MRCFVQFLLVILCVCIYGTAQAQDIPSFNLRNGNTGTEFYLSFPPASPIYFGSATTVKIYVSAPVATLVTVEGEGYLQKKTTLPNEVLEFSVPVTAAQPYNKNTNQPPAPDATYQKKALHITSSDPVTVYAVTRFQYNSEGFLALPVSALGTQYTVASAIDYSDNGSFQYSPSEVVIVGAFDGTSVTFTLGGTDGSRTTGEGKGVNGLTMGKSKTIPLNKGDVFMFSGYGTGTDLSGSTITGTKPFGVISGNYCASIPQDALLNYCGFLMEMEMPRHTWGTTFVVSRIHGRTKNSYIKVFAKEANTQVFRNGQPLATITSVGGKLGAGYIDKRVSESNIANFIISSDKPISVTQYNTGKNDDNVDTDPFQIVLTPYEEFEKEVFFTLPGAEGSPAFTKHYANLVFALDDNSFIPDDLEVGIYNEGEVVWQAVKAKYTSLFETLPQLINGKKYGVKILELTEGVYRIRAKDPFAIYLNGTSNYGSYGYPASASLADWTVQDSAAPVPSFTMKADGSVSDGLTTDMPAEATKRTNMAASFMTSDLSYNYTYTPSATFVPGTRTLGWKLSVIDPTKQAKAVLSFIDRSGNDTTITVEYVGTQPSGVTATNYEFGMTGVGTYKQGVVKIINIGTQDVSITKIDSPQMAEFTMNVGVTLPYTLKGGKELPVSIKFQPTKEQVYSDFITFYSNSTSADVVSAFTGEGVVATISTDDADFGKVTIGSTSDKALAVLNTGKADLVISSAVNPVSSAFKVDMPALPYTVPSGGKMDYIVHYSPITTGPYSDKIVFHTNSTAADSVVTLTGEAEQPVDVQEILEHAHLQMYSAPNPARDETMIFYHLPVATPIRLALVNTLGQEVWAVAQKQAAGEQQVKLQTDNLPAGVYFLRLTLGSRTEIQSLTIVK